MNKIELIEHLDKNSLSCRDFFKKELLNILNLSHSNGRFIKYVDLHEKNKFIKIFYHKDLNKKSSKRLLLAYHNYKLQLHNLGIQTPANHGIITINNCIIFIDERISFKNCNDFEKLIYYEQNHKIKKLYIDNLFVNINKINCKKNMLNGYNIVLKTGIDLKLSNFNINSLNQFYQLDLIIPKIREGENIYYDKNFHSLDSETLEFIHFNTIGILYWIITKCKINQIDQWIIDYIIQKSKIFLKKIKIPLPICFNELIELNYKSLGEIPLLYKI